MTLKRRKWKWNIYFCIHIVCARVFSRFSPTEFWRIKVSIWGYVWKRIVRVRVLAVWSRKLFSDGCVTFNVIDLKRNEIRIEMEIGISRGQLEIDEDCSDRFEYAQNCQCSQWEHISRWNFIGNVNFSDRMYISIAIKFFLSTISNIVV